MNIRLVRLYSEDDSFRAIDFKPGINLICGQKSTNSDGSIKSKKMNGVGKTLSTELINFCLFKTQNSKVLRINDKYLGRNELVYLHMVVDGTDVIVGRSKSGQVRIKTGINSEFDDYDTTTAKKYLENLLQFNTAPITMRDYFNFFIKESGYTYEEFGDLYKSSYNDLLKIHYYFFELPVKVLKSISDAYKFYGAARKRITKVNKELKAQGLEIDKLQARKNALEDKVANLEDNFEYSQILDSLQTRSSEVNEIEAELETLVLDKKSIEFEISELAAFVEDFKDDIYIDDKDLNIVFNQFKAGLGDLVTKDFEQVRKFRDQLSRYKTELVDVKQADARKRLEAIEAKIAVRRTKVSKFYSDISETKKNHIVKSFRVYREEVNEFKNYEALLHEHESATNEANGANTQFAIAVGELSRAVADKKAIKSEFQKTFLDIHKYVTSSVEASFDFAVNSKFSPSNITNFFRFNVTSEAAGSTGANQMTAAIYDAALHKSPATSGKTYGMYIHDNLIFGLIEKDSSIQYLNYIHENFAEDELQYIATVNMDEFNYAELQDDFKYNVKEDVIIELTRSDPLFRVMSSSMLLNSPKKEEASVEEGSESI